ncbi:MAG: MotA/TolQ/ExbB proton channel family protein [Phycisphaerales bacterium]
MDVFESVMEVFRRGGAVMWPLLLLSVISLSMSVERGWFWFRAHGRGVGGWLDRASGALRKRDGERLARLVGSGRLVYADVVDALRGGGVDGSSAVELGESARGMIERFSASQSVIITAAPLLGILGTVLGIIDSFEVLSSADAVRDVNAVAAGIAEALITTAFGLIVALVTLFPHALFRAQVNRCFGNIERLVAAALRAG